jgi:hypothetical protein
LPSCHEPMLPRRISAAFSAMAMTAALVLPRTIEGITEASATRKPSVSTPAGKPARDRRRTTSSWPRGASPLRTRGHPRGRNPSIHFVSWAQIRARGASSAAANVRSRAAVAAARTALRCWRTRVLICSSRFARLVFGSTRCRTQRPRPQPPGRNGYGRADYPANFST